MTSIMLAKLNIQYQSATYQVVYKGLSLSFINRISLFLALLGLPIGLDGSLFM